MQTSSASNEGKTTTILKAAWLIIRYGLSLESVTPLYTKYIGNWGGEATTYRFEAMDSDGLTVYKTVQKKPMTDLTICAKADHTVLIEKNSYDVAAIRILAKDEYGNVLPVCNDAVSFEVSGPIALIGPTVTSLNGGMGGTYVKTLAKEGKATLTIRMEQAKEVVIPFEVQIERGNES